MASRSRPSQRFFSLVSRSVLLIALLLASADVATAQPRGRAQISARLDSAAAAHAAQPAVAGVAVAVVQGGDTLVLDGYGAADLEFDVPTPPDGVYEVGSITKQFTAAAILQLAEQDALDLDEAIWTYLPGFNTWGHRITVRQLLYHTSGLRSYTNMPAFEDLSLQALPRDTLVALIEAEPLRFVPGTAMSYSNTGYFLLGLIIEEVSGQPYASYIEEHLFAPTGMEDSHYCDEQAIVERRTHGYAWSQAGELRHKMYMDQRWPFAAGSVCSTAPDLVAWTRALHGGQVLSEAMYQEMTMPGRLADGTALRYAMGLSIHQAGGQPVIRHEGAINGYFAEARYYPEDDLTIVALQNSTGPQGPWLLADVLGSLVLGTEAPSGRSYDGDLGALAGRYVGFSGGMMSDVHVEIKDGALVVQAMGRMPATLEYASDLTWRQGDHRYTFVRAGDRIVELRIDMVAGYFVLRRIEER